MSGYAALLEVDALAQSGGTLTLDEDSILDVDTASVSGGTLVLLNAQIDAAASVEILSGGTFDAQGTLNGTLINHGLINVGGVNATNSLLVNGDYTQTGTLRVELNGYAPDYDWLEVTGLTTLAGVLDVLFIEGYEATAGDDFAVLTYGSRSGSFGTINLPSLSYGVWDPQYDDTNGTFTLWVLDPEE